MTTLTPHMARRITRADNAYYELIEGEYYWSNRSRATYRRRWDRFRLWVWDTYGYSSTVIAYHVGVGTIDALIASGNETWA